MWMEMHSFASFLLIVIVVSAYGSQPKINKTTRCEYYNEDECQRNSSLCGWQIEECKPPDGEQMRTHCFATWRNVSGKYEVTKACWLDDSNCYDKFDCTSTKLTKAIHFCCCEGDLCNKDISVLEVDPDATPESPFIEKPVITENKLLMTMICSLVPMVIVAVLVVFIFYMWKRQQIIMHNPLPTSEPPTDVETPTQGVRPVQLLEVKARGRFGRVWRAQMVDQIVAVKVFPLQDKQSWMHETEFFRLPLVGNHENILKFIAAEKRLQVPKCNGQILDLWLISEFHEKGSLYDFLKGHSLSWVEMLNIARGLAKGLAFVHDDILPTEVTGHKPAVAHRDFKSKNVLIKSDLTACIADFGLALLFEPGSCIGDTHGQVGTRRYMAPEVLEGAINFNRDAFLRIDMYACGLVLWELLSRCTAQGPVEEYKLPFEEEVGQLPTLADLQHHVVTNRNRPLFKDHWLKHPGVAQICQTIEECWDHDPEARLSAGCVEERLNQLCILDTDIQIQQTVALLANQALPNKESSF